MSPTTAKIMNGTVRDDIAALDLVHRRERFGEISDLPEDIFKQGDKNFRDALFKECPALWDALREGTSPVERRIVAVLRRVIWQIEDLEDEWVAREACAVEQQDDGAVHMSDADK